MHAIRMRQRHSTQWQRCEGHSVDSCGLPDLHQQAACGDRQAADISRAAECGEHARCIAAPGFVDRLCGNRPTRKRRRGSRCHERRGCDMGSGRSGCLQRGANLSGELVGGGTDHHLQSLGRRTHESARTEPPQRRGVDQVLTRHQQTQARGARIYRAQVVRAAVLIGISMVVFRWKEGGQVPATTVG